jgi:hypothetical protein
MCSLNHTTDQRKRLGYVNQNLINQIQLNPQINENNEMYKNNEDNHDSWVTCTTSAECKTVIAAVLTVISSMDPHMISGNPGFGLVWLVCRSGSY